MLVDKRQTVREIAINNPATVRVFERLGIDYCCAGKRPLEEACDRAKVPVDALVEELNQLTATSVTPDERQWTEAALTDLAAHIGKCHHRYVCEETPRLEALLHKVVGRHGEAHPELKAIQENFLALSHELFVHMMKEERVLFPFVEKMEMAAQSGGQLPVGCFASVEFPISRMLADHDDAGALAAKIRELSAGYVPPEGACPSYRALYHGLEEFERDLHVHVHLENNILFPRAVEMERSLQGRAHASN